MSNLVDELLTWFETHKALLVDGERLCEDTCEVLVVQGKSCSGLQIASLLVEDNMSP